MSTAPELCVLCRQILEEGYYVRRPGKKYIPAFICNNRLCDRYGLLSILKLAKLREPME